MKSLNSLEFEHLLRFIVKRSILSDQDFKLFEPLLLKAAYWPQGEAQSIAIDYLATMEISSFIAASRSFGRRAANISTIEFEKNEAIDLFHFNIDSFIFEDLGKKLLDNPRAGQLILSNFKWQGSRPIGWLGLKQNVESVIAEHLKQSKEGDTRIIIPQFEKLSKAIGGFNPGRITIISAQSGFGKTKLAINLGLAIMKAGWTCLYANMEMTKEDFIGMIVQKEAKINNDHWLDGSFITTDNLKLIQQFIEIASDNFQFTDGQSLSVSSIYNDILEKRPQFIVIDYDQKLINDGGDEWMAMLKSVEKLENASKQAFCHVILLAQGNEDGDIKSSKRAKQPASAVLNFYKHDDGRYYIKSLKNRFNRPFVLEVNYRPEISLIEELDFQVEQPKPIKKDSQWSHLFPMK